MTEPDDRYYTLAELAQYSRLSVQTLARHVRSETNPLPHFRVGTRVLVRRIDFDHWLEKIGTPRRIVKARTLDKQVEAAVADALGDDQVGVLGGRRK